jgi:glucosyl-dolichyl phosphate glucuronosyltransferase
MRYVIIIPTNRPAGEVIATIESCTAVGNARHVIVVDNLPDRSQADLASLDSVVSRHAGVRLVRDLIPGLLAGRMRGALGTDSDVVVYLDDDVLLGSEWVEGLHASFADPTVCLVGGPSVPEWGGAVPDWIHGFTRYRGDRIEECAWLSLLDLGAGRRLIDPNYVWGLNFAIRRSVLMECEGFHPDCMPDHLQHFQGNGETGLTAKIAATGRIAVYEPRMRVAHRIGPNRLTPVYFYRRAFYQGVCDSYTHARRSHIEDGSISGPQDSRWLGRFRDAVGAVWDTTVAARTGLRLGKDFAQIKQGTERAYKAGYEFHQTAFGSCPAVRNWVLKKDYWDYKLPKSTFDATATRRGCLARHGVPESW